MAVATELPNGHIVLLLSPREAVLLADEILTPGDFPWQSSEAQIIGMEVRANLMHLASRRAEGELNVISTELMEMARQQEGG